MGGWVSVGKAGSNLPEAAGLNNAYPPSKVYWWRVVWTSAQYPGPQEVRGAGGRRSRSGEDLRSSLLACYLISHPCAPTNDALLRRSPPHRAGQVLASEWGTCFRCWGGVSPPVPPLALAIRVQVLLALLVLLQDHHRPGPEAQAKLLNNSIQLLAVLAILLAPILLAPHLERQRIHV